MNTSLPDYFEPRTTELDHLRLPYNHKRWPYWFVTTYEDTYQAYLSVGDFKTRTRLNFDYSTELRMHIIHKSFKRFRNSGVSKLKTFSVPVNHHTFQDFIVSADLVVAFSSYLAFVVNTNEVVSGSTITGVTEATLYFLS